eukprot:TRINITY_DN5292_c0_g1_i1.p1 TRINITY_DN5292_c0_g1~~TRINITY_DN5292_c0_g1_i1.p1  ORF type:complete len:851 (+),score=122.64 TRINITY_DN5292_c0_g1_i1:56-2608(+)
MDPEKQALLTSPIKNYNSFAAHRWSVVTTPGTIPSRGDHEVELPKPENNGEGVRDFEFHDFIEDQKWSAVDHERVVRDVHGTIAEAWYKVQGWVAVAAIGMLVGTIGSMVHLSTLWVHGLTRGVCQDAWYLPGIYCEYFPTGFHHWPHVLGYAEGTVGYDRIAAIIYTTSSCIFATSASYIVFVTSRQAAGAGIPEIKAILGGAEISGFASIRTGLAKWAALVLAVGGSLSIGKAAPLMHIAFCIGSAVARRFEKYRHSMGKQRELLTAATAAGVCVAFGAPLGGVLYAFEETSSFFNAQTLYRSFLCSVIAGATLQLWDPFKHGALTLFTVNYHVSWNFWELPLFVLVGICGGVIGTCFNSLHLRVATWRRIRKMHPVLEVFLVTVLTCFLQIIFLPKGFYRTDAEYLQILFRHCDPAEMRLDDTVCPVNINLALKIGVLKFFLTALSFGMMVPAGLFMPNLVIGGCMGWFIGNGVDTIIESNPFGLGAFATCSVNDSDCVVPSIYAIVGSASVMCGVNRMTLSLVTIMFELTGGMEYIIPVTLGVMTSKWIAEALGGKESIYNLLMEVKGLPFLDPRLEGSVDSTSPASVSDIMDINLHDVYYLTERATMREVLDALDTDVIGFPIVKSDTERRLLGYISRRQLSIALEDLDDELHYISATANDDIPVIFSSNISIEFSSDLNTETPFSRFQRTPSIFKQTPGIDSILGSPGIPKYAYDLHGYVDVSPISVHPQIEVSRVVMLFRRLGLSSILVVDHDNILLGLLTKLRVINHLHQVQNRKNDTRFAACPGGTIASVDRPRGGFHQSEMESEVGGGKKQKLPALPQGAMVIRARTIRKSRTGSAFARI